MKTDNCYKDNVSYEVMKKEDIESVDKWERVAFPQ